jgi:hypothetical protein
LRTLTKGDDDSAATRGRGGGRIKSFDGQRALTNGDRFGRVRNLGQPRSSSREHVGPGLRRRAGGERGGHRHHQRATLAKTPRTRGRRRCRTWGGRSGCRAWPRRWATSWRPERMQGPDPEDNGLMTLMKGGNGSTATRGPGVRIKSFNGSRASTSACSSTH